MSNSNIVWLWNYKYHSVVQSYSLKIFIPDIYDPIKDYYLSTELDKLRFMQKTPKNIAREEQAKAEWLELLDKYKPINKKFFNREFVEPQYMPTKLFLEPGNKLPRKKDVFFSVMGGLALTEKLYEVVSQFNLGKTHFSRVFIHRMKTQEQISDIPYYFINVAEKFDFLDREKSKGIEGNRHAPTQPKRFIGAAKDDDIQLKPEAKDLTVDLWHEEHLHNSLFFSDRLVQALLAAGFTAKQLGLIRCVIQDA